MVALRGVDVELDTGDRDGFGCSELDTVAV